MGGPVPIYSQAEEELPCREEGEPTILGVKKNRLAEKRYPVRLTNHGGGMWHGGSVEKHAPAGCPGDLGGGWLNALHEAGAGNFPHSPEAHDLAQPHIACSRKFTSDWWQAGRTVTS